MSLPTILGAICSSLTLFLATVTAAPDFDQTSAESLSTSFRKASRRVLPAVVTVRSLDGAPPAFGTPPRGLFPPGGEPPFGPRRRELLEGPFPTPDTGASGVVFEKTRGLILTNDHVVPDGPPIVVTLPDGRERPVKEIRRDPRSDLALLTIDPDGLTAEAVWAEGDRLDIGDWVLAIGQPFGLSGTVTAGIVSGKARGIRFAQYEDLIQTDAAINPGNSGGPLINLQGEVVGINTAIKSLGGGYEGVGFAIPAARARKVASDLAEFGRVRRAYLGVRIESPDPNAIAQRGREAGVPITTVAPSSPAADAGLRVGDVIVKVGETPVSSPGILQSAVEFAPIHEPLTLTILRDDKTIEVQVRPGEPPETAGRPEPARRPPAPESPEELFRRLKPQPPENRQPDSKPEPDGRPRRETTDGKPQATLGLTLVDPSAEPSRRSDDESTSQGVLILRVEPGSPADRGGLEAGMRITEMAGQKVSTVEDVRRIAANRPKGTDLVIGIRDGAKTGYRVILGESAEPPAFQPDGEEQDSPRSSD